MSCDPAGIVRIHFNSGTLQEPKFTVAEVVPIFPPQVSKDEKWNHQGWWTWPHSIPKITLFDWNKRGVPDLVFRNYTSDVCIVENTGNVTAPVFPQPQKYERVRVPLGSKPWGNLFAPCVYDWNKDGKPDQWEIYDEGRLQRLGVDLDFDGRVDRWDRDEIALRDIEAKEKAEEAKAAEIEAAKKKAEEAEGAPVEGHVSPRKR